MSEEFAAIEISVLDKSFTIKCPSSEQGRLRESAAYLDQKMREIRSSNQLISLERIAVLAALNMAYELLFQEQAQPDSTILDDITKKLRHSLEQQA
jgi:cell division protein ZapA